jgi:molybdopterin synthase catalytic subunit
MSWGSTTNTPQILASVQDGPVSVVDMDWPGACGGECVFLGRTRNESHPELGPLIRLEYEVYGPMAAKVLETMAQDATKRFGCQSVRIVHAQGPVQPGEASVVIQVATPHRGESFEACRYLIDRLKHDLPVWKREVWRDGETFVDGCCAGHGERLAERPSADTVDKGVDHDG